MSGRRVRFTATARNHVAREQKWWRENREHQELFASELEEAVRILALLPGVGTVYSKASIGAFLRVYLRKLNCHIYYTLDNREVIVRALWGARKERGPTLR